MAVHAVMEAMVLVLISISPWAFGSGEPVFEFVLYSGLALLLLLWATKTLAEWRWSWKRCPVSLCLAGLFLVGILQLVPLGKGSLLHVSPGTARIYDEFLPAEPEVLPAEESPDNPRWSPGSTISLSPGSTRQELVKLLAVILFFALIRNHVVSSNSLRRFSIVVVINGTLLAFVGIAQYLSSPLGTIYWRFPSGTHVFGPFIHHGDYAFYMNMCIGLGLGLLLSVLHPSPPPYPPLWKGGTGGVMQDARFRFSRLADAPVLWIGSCLALMLASVFISQSRGGVLALVATVAVCLIITRRRSLKWSLLGIVLTAGLGAAVLTWWVGWTKVEARLATIWHGDTGGRVKMWREVLPVVKDFPVWGTGLGTFNYVEPLFRSPDPDDSEWEYAHNEYLEALIEGGIIRLTLSLAAIALVLYLGYRAATKQRDTSIGALALGGLFAFLSMLLHSIGESGLHVPASALLTAAVAAHLVTLGRQRLNSGAMPTALRGHASPVAASNMPTQSRGHGTPINTDEYSVRLWGVAPIGAALGLATLGLLLFAEGRRQDHIERFRVAASALRKKDVDGPGQIRYREAAFQLDPDDPELRRELAETCRRVYEQQMEIIARVADVARVAGMSSSLGVAAVIAPAVPLVPVFCPEMGDESPSWEIFTANESDRLAREYLWPALRHFRRARDLCPLMPEPHIRIAAHADQFVTADSPSAYRQRAKRAVPSNPDFWYRCGLQELDDEEFEAACASWRRSLEISSRHLPAIVQTAGEHFDSETIIDDILLPKADMVLAAAQQLYPEPDTTAERAPFLRKALDLLNRVPAPSANDLHTKASIHASLEEFAAAEQAYRHALSLEPLQQEWRYEFARLLYDQQRLDDARRELRTLLFINPGHQQARQLLQEIAESY